MTSMPLRIGGLHGRCIQEGKQKNKRGGLVVELSWRPVFKYNFSVEVSHTVDPVFVAASVYKLLANSSSGQEAQKGKKCPFGLHDCIGIAFFLMVVQDLIIYVHIMLISLRFDLYFLWNIYFLTVWQIASIVRLIKFISALFGLLIPVCFHVQISQP